MRNGTNEAIEWYLYDVIRLGEFDDPHTGEVNLTSAAKSCFVEFDIKDNDERPYEIAFEVAEKLGKVQTPSGVFFLPSTQCHIDTSMALYKRFKPSQIAQWYQDTKTLLQTILGPLTGRKTALQHVTLAAYFHVPVQHAKSRPDKSLTQAPEWVYNGCREGDKFTQELRK